MKGRGVRPLRGLVDKFDTAEERRAAIAASSKGSCMIVDLVGVSGMADCASTAHILAEGKPDEVIDRANKNMLDKAERGEQVDVADEVRSAETEICIEREERERAAQQEADRRARLRANVDYTATAVQQGHGGRNATKRRGWRMPFGKHKGQLLADVPGGYLEWAQREGTIRNASLLDAVTRELRRRDEAPKGSNGKVPTGLSIDDANALLLER